MEDIKHRQNFEKHFKSLCDKMAALETKYISLRNELSAHVRAAPHSELAQSFEQL